MNLLDPVLCGRSNPLQHPRNLLKNGKGITGRSSARRSCVTLLTRCALVSVTLFHKTQGGTYVRRYGCFVSVTLGDYMIAGGQLLPSAESYRFKPAAVDSCSTLSAQYAPRGIPQALGRCVCAKRK